MNKITHKERTEKNNIVCPNCHINIKVLTDDLFLNMGDEWHEDMYISHEDEYLERKALQQRIDKAIEYIENNDLYTQDIDYDYDENMVLLPPTDELERQELLDILRGKDNEN